MTNQQITRRNFDDRSEQLPSSKKVYAFADVPKSVQENLLRLQNTDDDFLRTSSGETERRAGLLMLVAMAAIGLAAIVADASTEGSLDLKRIIVFSADALILVLWFVYFVWGIFKAVRAPLKNRIYITRTQLIETMDGLIRYRELKDAAEISVNKYWTDIGARHTLDIKFPDGDSYQYRVYERSTSGQLSVMQEWQEKAMEWKNEASNAWQRGDKTYLESQSVFSKLSASNTPVLRRKSYTHAENVLLIITIALISLNGAFVYFLRD